MVAGGGPDAKRALVAASLGWMLDSLDVMLYALVLASLMSDLGMTAPTPGLLGSVTIVASAAGGMLFGVIVSDPIRAAAQGFTCDTGRLASAVARFAVGSLAQTRGFSASLSMCSVAFVLAAVFWIWIPETRGRELR